MQTYIALLRGINVSGQKKVKMADLRNLLETIPFQHVQTYIQSGNILFEHEQTAAANLEEKIASTIREKYGFEVSVLVKTPEELNQILENNPFLQDPGKDPNRMYFTLLSEVPAPERIEKLKTFDYHPEEYVLDGTTVYFFSPHGYGRARMNNNFFENQLKVSATTRNLKTMQKLVEMAG
jgi:uncharacterized protein (DUF1697 family)